MSEWDRERVDAMIQRLNDSADSLVVEMGATEAVQNAALAMLEAAQMLQTHDRK